MAQKITPYLWFDKEAKEATAFYVSVFGKGSKVTSTEVFHDTPSGDIDIVSFTLCGQNFMAMSAGPVFKLNPSISFFINCTTKEEVDTFYQKLSPQGKVLMPLDIYPFGERYAWIEDRFGVSWQLILTKPEGEMRPKIVPSFLFVGKQCGNAEKAIDFYLSIFKNTKKGVMARYEKGQGKDKPGTLMYGDFMIANHWFAAMDSAHNHTFFFNEAVSFLIDCKDQKEVDYYWKNLLKNGGKESQCGWLKDKFGVSWQIVPQALNELMSKGTKEQSARVMQAMLKMVKLDVKKLQAAFDGK